MEARRLDKLVADSANVSRKEARSLIRRGQVTVNGAASLSPDAKAGPGDTVRVGGRPLHLGYSYIMLNKPAGVLCATRDNKQETVLDLLPPELRRKGLFPAGRLDKDTRGLVLLTDDGPLAHRLLAPKNHIPKTYQARLDQPVEEAVLAQAFAKGLLLDGGDRASPAWFRLVEEGPTPLAEVIIYEGMYHQVKRMFARFSLEVLELCRTAMGALPLDQSLQLGAARELEPEELALLTQTQPTPTEQIEL